jgi:hypothetical protein
MNKILPILLAGSIAVSLYTKGGEVTKTKVVNPPTSTSDKVNQGITVNKIAFQNVTDISILPKAMQEKIEALKTNRGFYLFENKQYGIVEDGYHLVINLGERSNSGYGVKVKLVEDNEGKTLVYVEETKPAAGSMNAMVITYPYTVIKIKGVTTNVKVIEEKAAPYVDLKASEKAPDKKDVKKHPLFKKAIGLFKKIEIKKGTYAGQIDSNTIEVNINGKPVAMHLTPLISGNFAVEAIKIGSEVELMYMSTGKGQNILFFIEETNPAPTERLNIIVSKGVYQGQVDNASIEVNFDNKMQVLRLEEELRKNFNAAMFKKGTKIEFAYYKNSAGQLILVHMERVNK